MKKHIILSLVALVFTTATFAQHVSSITFHEEEVTTEVESSENQTLNGESGAQQENRVLIEDKKLNPEQVLTVNTYLLSWGVMKFAISNGYFYRHLPYVNEWEKMDTGMEEYARPIAIAKQFGGPYDDAPKNILLIYVQEDNSIATATFSLSENRITMITPW